MTTPRDPTTLDRPGHAVPDGRADRVEVFDDTQRRPSGSGGSGIAVALIVALAIILLLFFLF